MRFSLGWLVTSIIRFSSGRRAVTGILSAGYTSKAYLFRELLCIIVINKFPKGADMENFDKIQALIKERAETEARLNLIPYDGSPEVKENSSGRYLYIRKGYAQR